MMHTPTKEEQEERKKELIEFYEENRGNYCLLYNYMLTIKEIRNKEREKLSKYSHKSSFIQDCSVKCPSNDNGKCMIYVDNCEPYKLNKQRMKNGR